MCPFNKSAPAYERFPENIYILHKNTHINSNWLVTSYCFISLSHKCINARNSNQMALTFRHHRTSPLNRKQCVTDGAEAIITHRCCRVFFCMYAVVCASERVCWFALFWCGPSLNVKIWCFLIIIFIYSLCSCLLVVSRQFLLFSAFKCIQCITHTHTSKHRISNNEWLACILTINKMSSEIKRREIYWEFGKLVRWTQKRLWARQTFENRQTQNENKWMIFKYVSLTSTLFMLIQRSAQFQWRTHLLLRFHVSRTL